MTFSDLWGKYQGKSHAHPCSNTFVHLNTSRPQSILLNPGPLAALALVLRRASPSPQVFVFFFGSDVCALSLSSQLMVSRLSR